MKNLKSFNTLAKVLFTSGTFDISGGIFFIRFVGTGKLMNNPPTHSFYGILIASFLFYFAYLQFISAINIQRYLINFGVVLLSRVFF